MRYSRQRASATGAPGELYERIVIPTAVRQELSHAKTPSKVRDFMTTLPAWLQLHDPAAIEQELDLGAGEKVAIALAQELQTDLLVDHSPWLRGSTELPCFQSQ